MWMYTFNEMRKMSKMSLDELCEKSGVPKGTLTKITSGVTKAPSLETMRSLVYAMGYTLKDLDEGIEKSDTLSKDEKDHLKKYRLLDPYGKEAVDTILEIEHQRCAAPAPVEQLAAEKVIYIFPGYTSPMSAGTGQPAGDEYPENYRLVKEPPRRASFIAPVSGDSMEPTYNNGDLVFVRAQEEVEIGEIGVFWMDGQQWIKELGDGVLISHNPDPQYGPRPFTEDIKCQGLVLGVCDDSYFE